MWRFFMWEKRAKARIALVLLICAAVNPLLGWLGLTPIPMWCLVPIGFVFVVWVFIQNIMELDYMKTLTDDDWGDDDDFNLH